MAHPPAPQIQKTWQDSTINGTVAHLTIAVEEWFDPLVESPKGSQPVLWPTLKFLTVVSQTTIAKADKYKNN